MHEDGDAAPQQDLSARTDEEVVAPLRLRESPSGRTPKWVVEEALEQQRRALMSPGAQRRERRRHDRAARARRTDHRRARARGRRARAWRAAPALGIVVLVLLWFTPSALGQYVLPSVRPYLPGATAPPPGVEAAGVPLGTPPAVPASDGYRFHEPPAEKQDMVAFDPCRPVHYVVRPDGAPPGGRQLVEDAVAEISAATGLQFVDDGDTAEAPAEDRDAYQPDRYGKRWAPVLIAWSDPREVPALAGDVAGLGGPSLRRAPGGPFVYVTGQITLDAPGLEQTGEAHVRAVIMHELAHVVGLDHVDDPGQLMHPVTSTVTSFADGDRAGLARLGAGECVPRL